MGDMVKSYSYIKPHVCFYFRNAKTWILLCVYHHRIFMIQNFLVLCICETLMRRTALSCGAEETLPFFLFHHLSV